MSKTITISIRVSEIKEYKGNKVYPLDVSGYDSGTDNHFEGYFEYEFNFYEENFKNYSMDPPIETLSDDIPRIINTRIRETVRDYIKEEKGIIWLNKQQIGFAKDMKLLEEETENWILTGVFENGTPIDSSFLNMEHPFCIALSQIDKFRLCGLGVLTVESRSSSQGLPFKLKGNSKLEKKK